MPDEARTWRRLLRSALSRGEYEAARQAALGSGSDATVRLAELSILQGAPDQALAALKGRTDAVGRSLAAWALFLLDDRAAAARIWQEHGDEGEKALGDILAATLAGPVPTHALDVLRGLALDGESGAAAVATQLAAEICAARKDFRRALTWGRRAEWLMPHNLAVKRLVARIATQAGDRRQATARWKDIAARHPADAESHEMLGLAALENGQADEARAHFLKALENDPFRAQVHVLLGDMADDAEQDEEAVAAYEKALRIDPRHREALSRLAEFFWDTGDTERTFHYLGRLHALGFPREEEEESLEMLGYLYAEMWLSGQGELAAAHREFFSAAIERYPSNLFLRVYAARCLIATEDIAPARALLEKVVQADPLMPEAVFELGSIHLLDRDYKRAMPLLIKAARLDPDVFYKKELARAYLDQDRWEEAEQWFKRALADGTEDDELLLGLYAASFHQGKYAAAENLLRRVLTLTPQFCQARAYLGEVLLLARPAEALAELRRVKREVDAGNGEEPERRVEPVGALEWLLGFGCLLAGERREAGAWFDKALSLAPDLADWCPELKALVLEKLPGSPRLPAKLARAVAERMRS